MHSKPTLETILSHRSIRKFTQQPIAPEILAKLIDAGRAASTSNNLQCISIIRVTDPTIRDGIRDASGMVYVSQCAEFLVFCIDFHKHKQMMPEAQVEWTEASIIGAVDAGIMAQNVLLAAESLGLGGVYIGALRNNIEQVSDLLKLPDYCIPLLGLCLGYPNQDPPLKPRLPPVLMCYENHYAPLNQQALTEYNDKVADYYQKRIGTALTWQESIRKSVDQPIRPHILPFFNKKGLLKK